MDFCALSFVEFLFLSNDAFFILSCFSLIAIDSHGTLYLAFGFFNMHSAVGGNKVFIFVIWSMCFRCFLNSIKLSSYSHCILISNITSNE